MKNKIVLNKHEKNEINKLKDILYLHIEKYKDFKAFTKISTEALEVADALLTGDFNAFKKHKLKYTTHTAEKMRGIQSLSTYKKTSSVCQYLSACGGICAKCYAEKSIKLYQSSLTPALIYNTLLLKYIEIDSAQIPFINDRYFRFEAFSDLQGARHFTNLLKICKKNKDTVFTLWSKAVPLFNKWLDDNKIQKLPSNLNIIYSEYNINKRAYNDSELLHLQRIIKSKNAIKYFIVYDNENERKNSGFYQCKNKCIDCLKCYKKASKPVIIAERLH